MGLFDSIKGAVSGHFDKKKEEQELFDNVQKEAQAIRMKTLEEEFRKNATEVAISTAKKDAAQKSGLQKLRALNRARNLTNPQEPKGSFFENLSEYTHKNIARREENLSKTEMLRKEADKMRKEKQAKQVSEREKRMANRNSTGFNKSSWKK